MNFGIIIPCYNEEKNIISLIQKIKKNSKPKFIVLVDDSKKSMKSFLPNKKIIYIHRKKKLGRGSAVILGIKELIKRRIKIFIEMDADHSHNPYEIKKKLNIFYKKKLDLLISSRYESKSKIIGWPLQRRILSKFSNFIAKFLLRVPVNDYTNGFRVYSRRAALKIVKNCGKNSYEFITLSEIIAEIYYSHYSVGSTYTRFIDRKFGKSSVSLNLIIKSFFGLLLIFLKYRKKIFFNKCI
jgi:dolichol-phosphate mannosyltransferase